MCNAHSTISFLDLSSLSLCTKCFLFTSICIPRFGRCTVWLCFKHAVANRKMRELNLLTTVVYTKSSSQDSPLASDQPRHSSIPKPALTSLPAQSTFFSSPSAFSLTTKDFIIYFKKVGNINDPLSLKPDTTHCPPPPPLIHHNQHSWVPSTLPQWENTPASYPFRNHLSSMHPFLQYTLQ